MLMHKNVCLLHVNLDITSTKIKSDAFWRSAFINNTINCSHKRKFLCHVSSRQEMINFLRCCSTLKFLTIQHFLFNFLDTLTRLDKCGSNLSITATSTSSNKISNTARFYIKVLLVIQLANKIHAT